MGEVENPSILKTGRLNPNTASAKPPAAARYRASDLVLWHEADMNQGLLFGRYRV
ncbi:MAG TPA: hypothetical protein VF331_28495 [Polyangiales bacterium]